MPSAITADNSDSMAPSIAIANAAEPSWLMAPSGSAPSPHGNMGRGGSAGIPRST